MLSERAHTRVWVRQYVAYMYDREAEMLLWIANYELISHENITA